MSKNDKPYPKGRHIKDTEMKNFFVNVATLWNNSSKLFGISHDPMSDNKNVTSLAEKIIAVIRDSNLPAYITFLSLISALHNYIESFKEATGTSFESGGNDEEKNDKHLPN